MRPLFIALAKLLGIYLIYDMLGKFVIGFFMVFSILNEYHHLPFWTMVWQNMMIWGVPFILSGVLAWLLLFKTHWLADKLGIIDRRLIRGTDARPLLQVSIRLIGVYMVVSILPNLVILIIDLIQSRDVLHIPLQGEEGGRLYSNLLTLLLGLALVFMTSKIMALITSRDQPGHDNPVNTASRTSAEKPSDTHPAD
jgi:hypothetical protein